MKIAILLLNRGRGSGEVTRQQATYLMNKGHDIYFMHPQIGQGLSGATNLDIPLHTNVVPVHEYLPVAGQTQKAVSKMSYEEAVSYLPDYEHALESVIKDTDIVIGHHANISSIVTYNIARRYNKPYVLFLHGTGIEPRHHGMYDDKLWDLIQKSVENASGVIVTTEYVRDNLVRKQIDIPLERFIVLPCGVDLHEFHPASIDGIVEKYNLPERYVICPGALTQSKGPQNVVEASKHFADLAPMIFIGDGELRQNLESELGERGRFLGFVSAEDKAKLINAATLLVAAPEKKEHFGIIYVEGLAGGTPAVTYKGGGVASIITSETGILTKRSPTQLGITVRELLQDRQRCHDMAKAGRKRAETHFSYIMLGEQLEAWLLKLNN